MAAQTGPRDLLSPPTSRRWVIVATFRGRWGEMLHPVSIATVVGLLVLWQLASVNEWINPRALPPLTSIPPAATELLAEGELQVHIAASLFRALAGFGLAVLIGLPAGLAIGTWRWCADVMEPVVDLIRQIPPVAWLPLALIWFGIGEGSKVFVVFFGAVWPILINTADGVRSVPRGVIHAAESLGAGPRAVFFKVALPATMPAIFTGLTLALGNAVSLIVAAELGGAFEGVGRMMFLARETFRTDVVLVGMVVLMLLGTGAMGLMQLVRRRLLRWHVSSRS
ncbi:MAG: ABC transporter permease subunit [Nitriliruptorales bacterium]|nr:ABC transporter permease subunit [Nitriliruptorales bacterium]